MTSIAESLTNALDVQDQALRAHVMNTGRFLNRLQTGLADIKATIDLEEEPEELDPVSNPRPLPAPAYTGPKLGRSRKLTKEWMMRLMRHYKVAGRTKAIKMSKKDLIEWLKAKNIDVFEHHKKAGRATPTREQLMKFWESHGSPALG